MSNDESKHNASSTHAIKKLEQEFARLQLSERILPEAFRSAVEASARINSDTFNIVPSSTLQAIENATSVASQHSRLQTASSQFLQAIEDAKAKSSVDLLPPSARAIAEAFANQQQKISAITDRLTPLKTIAAKYAEMSLAISSSSTFIELAKLNKASLASIDATMEAFEQSSVELGANTYSNYKETFENIARELADTHGVDDKQSIGDRDLENIDDISSASPKAIESLVNRFKRLPPLLQPIFIFWLKYITLPIVVSIAANLLTPEAEQVCQDSDKSERQKLKEIQQLPLRLDGIETNGLRFITAEHLRLRQEPSTKSHVVDDLKLGQIVTVLSKNRNWIEVRYEYENGEVVTGWVFTRYTSRFIL